MTALNEGWSLALAVVVTVLLATITAAVWWPAWRASKLDPATVLRES